jgi:hypothetical protein
LISLTDVDTDILSAALNTYELERAANPENNPLASAILAGLYKHEENVTRRIAAALRETARLIRDEEAPSEEGAAALEVFAMDLESCIPFPDTYMPADDDIAEVSIIGEIKVYEHECPDCGAPSDSSSFSVQTSDNEYFFDPMAGHGMRIRLITRGLEDYL